MKWSDLVFHSCVLILYLGLVSHPMRAQENPVYKLPTEPNPEQSFSSSGQFIIRGLDPDTRRSYGSHSQSLRDDLTGILKQPLNDWTQKIIVRLYPGDPLQPVQRRVAGSISPTPEGGYRFQMNVLVHQEFDPSEFQTEMIRMLIQERMIYPRQPQTPQILIPAWILAGLEELVLYQRVGRPSDIYNTLIDSRQAPQVQEILATDPSTLRDSISRRIFRACSAALVQSLLDQGNGHTRFHVLLQDLAYSKTDTRPLLEQHFQVFTQPGQSLEKWWALQMAAMGERSSFDFLSPTETEHHLAQSLLVRLDQVSREDIESAHQQEDASKRFPRLAAASRLRIWEPSFTDFQTGSVQDFEQFIKDPRTPLALITNQARLRSLKARGFPLFQPVIDDYFHVCEQLKNGDSQNVAKKLVELDKQRGEILQQMRSVTDHMNWYTATQIEEETDAFDGYRSALKHFERLDLQRRQDPISKYLDGIEKEVTPNSPRN